MSRKVIFTTCLLLASIFSAIAFANETASYESIVIDNFDDSESKEWNWSVQCSRLVGEDGTKLQYVEAVPNSLRAGRSESAEEEKTMMVLGVETSFNRKGDNWIEVFPVKKDDEEGKPYEIPLIGKVSQMDVWVWGLGYNYTISMLIRDTRGVVRDIPIGNLSHAGWKNMVCKIPANVPQRPIYRTTPSTLSFVGFRIKTAPSAPVDKISVYFDNLKYLSNTFVNMFDGYELNNVKFDEDESNNAKSGAQEDQQ